ncbi:glycine betaine ABC transporter substrate-binding protein [Halobellus rubicundus]|uniref:Glycine betaine ABC transporter substrate-binding protein n=1 Tax=Halobellus rubicundus TaxID=2996466 RepID=A0ABD5MCZ8_9EURY
MANTRRDVLRRGLAASGATVLGSLAGCTGTFTGGGSTTTVTAASMQWTEAELMGYLGFESIKANTDVETEDELSLGGSMQCFQALKSGEISFYHLYTAGAYATMPPKHEEIPSDPEEVYQQAKQEMQEEHNLRYLERANFNNTYALAVRPGWQEETGIETISDLAEHFNGGNTDITVVLGPEFAEREDGWPGVTQAYGFAGVADELNIRKIGANLTYQVLGEGEAEVGMVFTTNPKIKQYDLAVLEDDQNFFAPYNPAPLARPDDVPSGSAVEEALTAPMAALSSEEQVIELNSRIAIDGEDVQDVAVDFLESEGII